MMCCTPPSGGGRSGPTMRRRGRGRANELRFMERGWGLETAALPTVKDELGGSPRGEAAAGPADCLSSWSDIKRIYQDPGIGRNRVFAYHLDRQRMGPAGQATR